ncbi:MAG: molybdopterin-dependent oxidoreductase [Spirochaetales bacterium]|nr:molybdopterin-dependent oxidoreductase [Spirochaetales bacterium]
MEIPVSCNKDCGGGCPLSAIVEDGRIVRITDSRHRGPWMSGCLRGYRAHRLTYHPDRIKTPLLKDRRTGSFRKVSWDDALDHTAERLSALREESGPLTVMRLGGSGSCRGALHNTSKLAMRFLNLYGGYTETTGSYSSAAVSFVTPFVYGTSNAAIDAGSLENSKFIFLPGANIADLRFGSELGNRLVDARKRGVEMIVADPRRTRTVDLLGARWMKIRPGTDGAFIAALIFDLCENGGIDETYIAKYCHGFDMFRNWLFCAPAKTPEWASGICGTPAGDIRYLAGCYRRYKPSALIPGLSIQRNLGGEDSARMAMVLQAVTGNTGIAGGSSGANIWGTMPNPACGKIDPNPGSAEGRVKRYFPVYSWADEVLNPLNNPPVRALYNCGGNYITQGADTAKAKAAFAAADFSVTHDFFMTPTAAASDVVFPVADFLERSDIVFPEGNFLLYSAQAVEASPGVKTDYEIFSLLSERLGFGAAFTEGRSEEQWLSYFLDNSDVWDRAAFKESGIFFGDDNRRVALSEFISDPEACRLGTPSGKIEISSEAYALTGASPFPVYTDYRIKDKIQLITPHSRMRINSQFSNLSDERNNLLMNTADAAQRGIEDGQTVIIRGGSGRIETGVRLIDDIMSGTACLEAGKWADFDDGSGADTRGSANVVTSSVPTMPSGGARTNSTWVEILALRPEDDE